MAMLSGSPAKIKFVPIGGRPTCLRKKMGKNLMVMPEARPKRTSDAARKYGIALLLKVPAGLCCCASEALPAPACIKQPAGQKSALALSQVGCGSSRFAQV